MFSKIVRNWYWYLPGIVIGAASGFFYWKYFGCNGTCMITSNPVRSIIYFAFMGLLVNQLFKPQKKEIDKHSA